MRRTPTQSISDAACSLRASPRALSATDTARASQGTGRRHTGRAAFIAVEQEVLAALRAGWTVRAIFEEKQPRLGVSYSQFARYVQRARARLPLPRESSSSSPTPAPVSAVPPRPPPETGRARAPPPSRTVNLIPSAETDNYAAQVLDNETLI